ELYFLIVHFLSSGPCKEAAKVLREEVDKYHVLPKRYDWQGNEHDQNYDHMLRQNSHIKSHHIFQLCKRLKNLISKQPCSPNVRIETLLGRDQFSLLNDKTSGVAAKLPPVRDESLSYNGCKPFIPNYHTTVQCQSTTSSFVARQLCGISKTRSTELITTNRFHKHCRILGHLAASYCLLFDRIGNCIITGADDGLVKIWSRTSGRLLSTLRGHQAEITDISINQENNLIASSSCDKIIRVWNLKTTEPVAVLLSHSSTITSLQITIIIFHRYLCSTSVDGSICFWKWDPDTLKFSKNPFRFYERSRPSNKMLCSSFSSGGTFLVTGSTDNLIRVYQTHPPPPDKIAELEGHTDRVDSIQHCHCGERFISGSRDGTARIWEYKRSEWHSITLNMSTRLQCNSSEEIGRVHKLKVTMVAWTLDDRNVITAVNDRSLKIWNSYTGSLLQILNGHADEVYVLEAHPTNPYLFLSAGHDGKITLWNLRNGNEIVSFTNPIEGQGPGAIFDCKFASDGLTFAASDSFGHLSIFGTDCSNEYKRLPEQMFFHTDYHPLRRDQNEYVIDEQSQQPPHLMPPPVLVNADGMPYARSYQSLVPGREKHSNCDVRQIIDAMSVTDENGRNRVVAGRNRNRNVGRSGQDEANSPPVVDNQLSVNFIQQDQVNDDDTNIRTNNVVDERYRRVLIENDEESRDDPANNSNPETRDESLLSPDWCRRVIMCDVKPAEAK
ncbi:uncharacterized protein TRIADDRAFT_25819, partial [Trichoplax adhaerens]